MLTYKDSDGVVRIEGCDEHNMEEMIHRCVDRLYEYERLGLTPEGVRKALRELKALRKASASEEKTDCDSVVELFNEICVDLPKVKMLTDTRRQAIGTADMRLRKADISWYDFFLMVANSGFLNGDTGWNRCSFDWIIKPSNMLKIIEGNYDDFERNQLQYDRQERQEDRKTIAKKTMQELREKHARRKAESDTQTI